MSENSIIDSNEINTEIILCFNYEKVIELYAENIIEIYDNNYLFNKEQIYVIIFNNTISNYNEKRFEKDDSRYDIKEDVSKSNNSIKLYYRKNVENSNDKNIK